MHELLFEYQAEWSALDEAGAMAAFVTYAQELELDAKAFETCLASGEFSEAVTRDQWEAERLGVTAVPAFLINDRRAAGAYPYAEFERLIEEELAQVP
jgi:predicted DsbA family dithiol-disulfide isomerase